MKEEEKKYYIWLSRIEGVGYKTIKKLLEIYDTPKEIWNLDKNELLKIEGIGEKASSSILESKYRTGLEKYLDYMSKSKIEILHIKEDDYPQKLKSIYDPPFVIYIKGEKNILNEFSIGMIGCREYSSYGKNVALNLSYHLSCKNINIVSGLARGIDTFSHIGCLKGKAKTIGVIGSGLDYIYPKENKQLYNEIIESGGAIISEHIIGTAPSKSSFPQRNRMISGLSDGILVVEAKEKSGTLITVDFALEQGKNVYVVPGNITNANSVGTNNLAKQGAKIITSIEDILEDVRKFE